MYLCGMGKFFIDVPLGRDGEKDYNEMICRTYVNSELFLAGLVDDYFSER